MTSKYHRDDRLIEADLRPLGQRVPAPLHERVEQLCELVYEAGESHRPSKMEMIAALLLAAPTDPDELVGIVRDYGRATVKDALVRPAESAGEVIELPTRKSGPRGPRRG